MTFKDGLHYSGDDIQIRIITHYVFHDSYGDFLYFKSNNGGTNDEKL